MFRKLLAFALVLIFSAVPCFGWGDGGHMAIALRAWDYLTPTQREAAMALLKQHPRYQKDFASHVPASIPAEDRDRWIFAFAATWPDFVWKLKIIAPADFHKYFHGAWHVIGQPVALDPSDQDQMPPLKSPPLSGDINQLTIREALPLQIQQMNDKQLPAGQRAVAMVWVMHLVGDLHEPCHCASLITPNRFKLPDGDHVAVRLPVMLNGHQTGLHQYWDSLYCSSSDWAKLNAWDQSVLSDPSLQPEQLPELQNHKEINQWIAESLADAEQYVYTPEIRQIVAAQDVDASKPFVPLTLTDPYKQQAEIIGRRRGALAGLRLDAILAATFGSGT